MSTAGFEYRNKKVETPFETFLRYTNEKEESAIKLAAILQEGLGKNSSVLDIGTGNGTYLALALAKTAIPSGVTLTLVEPSPDLAGQLEARFEKYLSKEQLNIINSDLQSFATDEQFDVILMSHLFYHVPRIARSGELAKALSLLKPTGELIIVLREKDDAYNFKMTFMPQLFGASFKALTIDDVLDALPDSTQVEIVRYSAAATLKIPFRENLDDTVSIIEFFLNKPWNDTPKSVQQGALDFIKNKEGIFKQLDGIAVIKKV